ncbi:cytochrome P450 [uncultured Mycobacterium sp.]|uniref:cytochrome P450 n=1 Tax=uncultured Mycobacterium sp. TaxID=171292 RepID=UPI0035CC7AD6
MVAVAQLPFARANPLQFAPQLRELQAHGVVHRVLTPHGDPAWLVTGHAEVQRLYDDERLGLSHPEPDKAARMHESAIFGGPMGNFATEPADHARKRALLQPHFTAKRLEALRPRVNALTTVLLDELAAKGPPADLYAGVALPLPILVICEVLGVPYEDREQFCAWITDVANTSDRARSELGRDRLFAYGWQLVAKKRREPGDDVVSRLCATEGVSDHEAAFLSMGLLFAGYENTAAHIWLGALLLLANPEQWRALAHDPALAAKAVEETLRAARWGEGVFPRYARTDLEVDGVTIKAGDLVLLSVGAANHDPLVFPDPDRIDITRRAAGHLTFGHGARYCIGAPLARLELHAVFYQLASRFPTLRLAVGIEDLTLRTGMLFGGLPELPVRW